MYVVNSTKWDTTRIIGQDRLAVDAWLEAVADDCDPVCWPPVFSALQLLKNLLAILEETSRGSLRTYHITHSCDEILARFEEGTWIDKVFGFDVQFLKEKLRWVRERTKDTTDDAKAREEMGSILRAFLHKVEFAQPWRQQLDYLCDKASDSATNFQVIIRAVADLTNELMHLGHSRAHLNRWVLRQVVRNAVPQNYVDLLRGASNLASNSPTDHEVLFHVSTPTSVVNSPFVQFCSGPITRWAVNPNSPFLSGAKARIAVVRVNTARDGHAAIVHARANLSRYLWSMRFHHMEFDRSISKHSAVREVGNTFVYEEPSPRDLDHRSLWNHANLDRVSQATHNTHTYTALQRILYWIEQTRRVEPIAAITSEWTALEFLFTIPGLSDLEAVEQFVPAYIAKSYPRWLVLDLWRFLQHIRPTFAPEIVSQIDIRQPTRPYQRATCNLAKFLDACLEDDATNQIQPLIADYPFLIAKWRRVKRLAPGKKPLKEDLDKFVQRLQFDIRTCYRTRNTVVHDAAMVVSENERLLQRLNWMLCVCVDQILFQFSRNPQLSLLDIHRCNLAGWEKWKSIVTDATNACTTSDVIDPATYFMR